MDQSKRKKQKAVTYVTIENKPEEGVGCTVGLSGPSGFSFINLSKFKSMLSLPYSNARDRLIFRLGMSAADPHNAVFEAVGLMPVEDPETKLLNYAPVLDELMLSDFDLWDEYTKKINWKLERTGQDPSKQ